MRRNFLAAFAVLLALPLAAQTINPNQIRPGTANGEVLTTVTANQPPSWQQVQSVLIQTNSTPNASQSTLNFSNTPSVSWSNPSGGIEQANVLVSGGFQNYTPDPLGTQSVVVPFTVATNNLDGGSPCFATSNTTSGQVGFTGGGANLGCQAPPGPTITWSAAQLPAYVTAANVTAIYAVGTIGYSGWAQHLNLVCSNPTPNSTTLMDGGTLDGSPDTGVLKAYSAQLSWATGANIGTISCVANVAANALGADNPTMNISNIQLRVYYTGTAPPASTALNVTSPLYINTAINALGVAAINLGANGDGGVIGLLPNANLANPSMTINGTTCTLGSSCTPSGGGGTTTNPLTAAATGGAAPGATFNGSAAVTFDYHSFGAAPTASPTFTGTVNLPFTTVIGGSPTSGQFWGYNGTTQGWFTPSGGGGSGCTGATANGVCFNSSGTGTYSSDVKVDVGGTPNVSVSANAVGVSLTNAQSATVSQLASLTTSNSVLQVGSFVRVSDGVSCGDTTVGGGAQKELLECSTITSGSCSAWAVFSCATVPPITPTPMTIPGLTYWYAADQIQAQTNNTGVMHWYNQYTGGIATAGAAPGPTYLTSQLNSLPALSFPGSSVGRMTLQYPVILAQSTIFVVFDAPSFASLGNFLSGATNALSFRVNTSDHLELLSDFNASIGVDTTTLATSTWYQADVTYDGLTTGNYAFRVARAAGASGTNLKTISATTSGLAYDVQAANADFYGSIAEVIVYGRVLTAGEITTVENYLHSKWGV